MEKQNKADKASSTDASAGKPSWDHINTDLKGALDTWDELTDKMANKLSPDEEQLLEIKSILGTLKDKLKAFEEDDEPVASAAASPAATSATPEAPAEAPTGATTENPTEAPAENQADEKP